MKSPSPRIRVLVVDDHAMVRRGLATFLRVFDDLELAGEAASGARGPATLCQSPARCGFDGHGHARYGWGRRDPPHPPPI